EESKNDPESARYLELVEHTITSEHHPYIEVRVKGAPVRKIEFTAQLLMRLKGFILKVQAGRIAEIQTGTCELEGTIEYKGLMIAKESLRPIGLPGSIQISEPAAEGSQRLHNEMRSSTS